MPSPVRNIHITDAQLKLIHDALEVAVPGLTPENAEEAQLLMGCIKDVVGTPEDVDTVLHGFCL